MAGGTSSTGDVGGTCRAVTDRTTKFTYKVVPANIDADTSKCYRNGLHTIEVCKTLSC